MPIAGTVVAMNVAAGDSAGASEFAILERWERILEKVYSPGKGEVRIAIVGKYTALTDAYKSLIEALTLSVLGGVFGIILGILVATLVNHAIAGAAGGWPSNPIAPRRSVASGTAAPPAVRSPRQDECARSRRAPERFPTAR